MLKLLNIDQVIRPDYSSPQVKANAMLLQFANRLPSAPFPKPYLVMVTPIDQTVCEDTQPTIQTLANRECQECLIYLSKCYCGVDK